MIETEDVNKKIVLDNRELIYLSKISKEGEEGIYAYKFFDYLKKTFGINVSPSQIYPILSGYEKKGLITSKRIIANNGRARRIYYPTFKTRKRIETIRINRKINKSLIDKIYPESEIDPEPLNFQLALPLSDIEKQQ